MEAVVCSQVAVVYLDTHLFCNKSRFSIYTLPPHSYFKSSKLTAVCGVKGQPLSSVGLKWRE